MGLMTSHPVLVTLVALVLAASLVPGSVASAAADGHETEGFGPCQDAPFARLDRHPRLRQHVVDGVRVLVLLPDRLDRARRYPTLYLLHGGVSVPDEWVTRMGIEALTAGRDVIVVMPDGGRAGYYRDWANGGRQWERFHIERLVPWVDATFPTVPHRGNRAVAGLSMGGGGAMYYAARHPDVFGSVASFSGAPLAFINTADHTALAAYVHDVQQRCEEDQTGVELFGVYGNPVTDEIGVRDNMPEDLALGLSNTLVYVSAGDGTPIDEEQRNLAAEHPDYAVIEPLLRNQANTFTASLARLGLPHVYEPTSGAHWWETFRVGLRSFLGLLWSDGFQDRGEVEAFDYSTARPYFDGWEWSFRIEDAAGRSFTTVRRASRDGFTISGRGRATVTTAPFFRPREMVETMVQGSTVRVRADRRGRITIEVPLGQDDLAVRMRPARAAQPAVGLTVPPS